MWEYSHEGKQLETNGFLDGYRRQAKFVRM